MDSHEQEVRNWSMFCHLSALAGLIIPLGNILGPLIVWQIKKNELPEINPHGKESLNFQLSLLVISIIFFFFLFSSLGYSSLTGNLFALFAGGMGLGLLLSLIWLTSWILVVIAAIRANNGEFFKYPCIRFFR
ncbi:MAG TPA: DUF4870 domain-containing protein [Puia sp.]|nr:DUF4870 domain-containing protein [Puia sp.]